ncbi:hypothetical protein RKD25_004428 [Streptomyces sp. SAI-124]
MPFSRNQAGRGDGLEDDEGHEEGVRADGRGAGEQQAEQRGERGGLHAGLDDRGPAFQAGALGVGDAGVPGEGGGAVVGGGRTLGDRRGAVRGRVVRGRAVRGPAVRGRVVGGRAVRGGGVLSRACGHLLPRAGGPLLSGAVSLRLRVVRLLGQVRRVRGPRDRRLDLGLPGLALPLLGVLLGGLRVLVPLLGVGRPALLRVLVVALVRLVRHRHPPANGGSTSTVPPSASRTVSCPRVPTGSPSTRNEHRRRTRTSSPGCRARAASSASASVAASNGSSAIPAAAFAAAQ